MVAIIMGVDADRGILFSLTKPAYKSNVCILNVYSEVYYMTKHTSIEQNKKPEERNQY